MLEVKVPRREAFKIVVPFLLAALAFNVEQHDRRCADGEKSLGSLP
jgi:hypothetical protein